MAKRTKLLPMRLIVSIVAVMLVAVVVPMGTMVADGMNDMVGGGPKVVKNFDTPEECSVPFNTIVGPYSTSEARSTLISYKDINENFKGSDIPTYYASALQSDLNEFIFQIEHERSEGKSSFVRIGSHVSPDYFIDNGVTRIDLTLQASTDKVLRIVNGDITFYGTDGINIFSSGLPFTISAENETWFSETQGGVNIHLTDEPRTFHIELKKVDVLRCHTELARCNDWVLSIIYRNSGADPEKTFNDGEHYGYMVELVGEPVNGYAISNIFVGILGVGLIVGAVFATPWVGRGTFDDIRKRRSRRKSQRRR